MEVTASLIRRLSRAPTAAPRWPRAGGHEPRRPRPNCRAREAASPGGRPHRQPRAPMAEPRRRVSASSQCLPVGGGGVALCRRAPASASASVPTGGGVVTTDDASVLARPAVWRRPRPAIQQSPGARARVRRRSAVQQSAVRQSSSSAVRQVSSSLAIQRSGGSQAFWANPDVTNSGATGVE